MPYKMMHMNVMVKPDPMETEKKTASGLYIPTVATSQEEIKTGEVVAVGPGVTTDFGQTVKPMAQVGDKVLFRSYQMGFEVTENEQKYLIFNDRDLLAVVS